MGSIESITEERGSYYMTKKFNKPGSDSSSFSMVEILFRLLSGFLKYSCVSGKSRSSGLKSSVFISSIISAAFKDMN